MDRPTKTAECAYFIWLRAGCPEGKALEHWLQVVAELAATSADVLCPGRADNKNEATAA